MFFFPSHPEGKAFVFVHLTASEPDNSLWSLIKFIYLLSSGSSKGWTNTTLPSNTHLKKSVIAVPQNWEPIPKRGDEACPMSQASLWQIHTPAGVLAVR